MKMLNSKRLSPFIKKYSFLSFILLLFVNALFSQDVREISWYTKNAPFKMSEVKLPVFQNKEFYIKDFGGINDGQFLNTLAFEKTISACSAAGGGKVIVTPGLWLTGPIQLKSNIDLEVQQGAIILFTKDHSQYPIIKTSNTSTSFQPASPIYGFDLKNIAITGEGIIDGGGDSWRPVKKSKATDAEWKKFLASGGVLSKDGSLWWPTKEAMDGEEYTKKLKQKSSKPVADDYIPARDFLRPHLLYLVNCENILVENVTLKNSPKFVFYPNKCTNLTMKYVKVFNEWWAQNGDGVDISACENVVIYKCVVSAGDDGICMKSSRGKSDNVNDFNLQNIVVAGCTVYNGHGGFVIGSNTDGGMRNIFVSDCNFIGTDIGIRVKSNAGRGGIVKDIYICNIYMSEIKNDAILFDTYYEDVPAGKSADSVKTVLRDKTPAFSDFHISNVYCRGAESAITITGLPEMPVSKLFFDNVIISSNKGTSISDATGLDLKKVKIITSDSPVYTLKNVSGFLIREGFMPLTAKLFIKSDKKCSGVKVLDTNLYNIIDAVQ